MLKLLVIWFGKCLILDQTKHLHTTINVLHIQQICMDWSK